jgi:hypothetical protein
MRGRQAPRLPELAVLLGGAAVAAGVLALASGATAPTVERPADLTSKAVVIVTLVDTKGHPMEGVTVSLVCSNHAVVSPVAFDDDGPVETDAKGVKQFEVTDGVPGDVNCLASGYTPADANVPGLIMAHRLDQSVTIRFTALTGRSTAPLDTHASTVTVSTHTLPADLTAKAAVTVTLKDTKGQPMAAVPVALLCASQGTGGSSGAAHTVVTPAGVHTDAGGVARFNVADGVSGSISCLASASTPGDANVPGLLTTHRLDQGVSIRFTPLSGRTAQTIDTKASSATVEPAAIVADLSSKATVTVTLKDTKGHAMQGISTSLACLQTGGSHAVVTPPVATSTTTALRASRSQMACPAR